MNPKNWYKGLRRKIHIYTLKRKMLSRLTFDTRMYSSCSLFVFAGLYLIKSGGKMGFKETLIGTLPISVLSLYPSVPKKCIIQKL